MKTKLLKLGLSEPLIDEILNIFDVYLLSKKLYDKPKGVMAFHDNLDEIKSLSKKLHKKLKKLTDFERQLLSYQNLLDVDILKLTTEIEALPIACDIVKNKDVKSSFSRKEPFSRQLALELWELLERYEIIVTVYRNNMLCRILDVLLDANPDDDRSFNLLREISKRKKKWKNILSIS